MAERFIIPQVLMKPLHTEGASEFHHIATILTRSRSPLHEGYVRFRSS